MLVSFIEDNVELKGISYGMNIVCPSCGEARKEGFYSGVYVDPIMRSAEYRCKCGHAFICYQGQVIMLNDWLVECGKRGHSYRTR